MIRSAKADAIKEILIDCMKGAVIPSCIPGPMTVNIGRSKIPSGKAPAPIRFNVVYIDECANVSAELINYWEMVAVRKEMMKLLGSGTLNQEAREYVVQIVHELSMEIAGF